MEKNQKYIESQKKNWNYIAETQNLNDNTHPDKYLAQLELDYLCKNINGRVLNVGCGMGSETDTCTKITGVQAIGVDLSEKMIEIAQKRFPDLEFKVANVLQLPFPNNSFDSVTTRRTLINVLDHGDQIKAIEELKRVLKPNGQLIIIEATVEGYNRLNSIRDALGLNKIEVVEYNLPIKEDTVKSILPDSVIAHLDNYYYLTRVFYPLIEKNVQYNTQVHNAAYVLQNSVDISLSCSPHILIKWKKPDDL